MKINQTFKNSVYSTITVLVIIGLLNYMYNVLEPYKYKLEKNEDVSTTLNHANTMYWYSRALGNTNIEFEEAKDLAKDAIIIASNDLKDSTNQIIIQRAKKIISLVDECKEQNELTVNNHIPFFIDLMNTNKTKEEDQAKEDMDKVATFTVLEKLIHVNDFSISKDLLEIPYFTLVNHQLNDEKLSESAVQFLNLNTNFYTISNHELTQIFGRNIPLKQIIADSTKLKKIADFFDTKQIQIIDVTKNDQYKGLYYYGAKAKRFDLNGTVVSNKYVESFVKERQFNTISEYKLPLFLLFIAIVMLVYFLSKTTSDENKRIKPIHFLIAVFSGIVFSIVFLELVEAYLSPSSGEFHETDVAEIWRWVVTLSFTFLPFVLVHLIIGKMDHYIEKFDSGLDIRRGIFSILLGTFMSFPIALAYYGIIRFSIDYHLYFVLISVLVAVIFATIISYFWIEIKNIPQKCSSVNKIYLWGGLLIGVFSYIMFVYNIIGFYTWENTKWTLLLFVVTPSLFFTFLFLGFKFKVFTFIKKKDKIETDDFIYSEQYTSIKKSLREKSVLVLYGIKGIGKSKIAKQVENELKNYESIVIDFSKFQEETASKVNYFPFAVGFEKYLSFSKFNNHADEARKSGNFIGKLLNSITSIGELLVVEKASDPEVLSVVLKQICTILDAKKDYLLVFENIHLAKNENEELLLELLLYFKKNKNKSRKLIFTANEFFIFKNNFENLIETIVDVPINRTKLFESPYFFKLKIDETFVSQYLKKMNFDVFDFYDLLVFFKEKEVDKIPRDVIQILKELENNGTIEKSENRCKLNQLKELHIPEINKELSLFESKIKLLSKDEINILLACVYSSDKQEEFEIDCLAYVLDIKRIEILQRLRAFEELEIIFDIKDKNNWFRFSDSRYILAIKRHECYAHDQISQLGKEYFKRFVQFYNKAIELNQNLLNQVNLITAILNKTLLIAEDLPVESFQILRQIGSKFLEPEISLLKEASDAFEKTGELLEINDNSVYFDNVEELKETILVTKLLKCYELRNDFENNRIPKIIEKYKNGIYKINISQFEYLQFAKSRAYKPDLAKIKQKEINDKLFNSKLELKDQLRLKFDYILMSPQRGANLDELRDIDSKYDELISELEKDKNLDLELNYLYAEVLNSKTSLIVDTIIGHSELIKNKVLQNEYFNQCKLLIAKRLNHELNKIQGNNSSLEIEAGVIEDNLYFLNYALETIQKFETHENFQKVDRKGLCFTFNFIVRSYFFKGIMQEKDEQLIDLMLGISTFSVSYNRKSDDIMGQIMAENFHGKLLTMKKDYEAAFESLEYAFYMAHKNGKNKALIMLDLENLLKQNVAASLKENFVQKFETYSNIILIQHLLRHFSSDIPERVKRKIIEQRIVNNEQELEYQLTISGSKFLAEKFDNPFDLLKEIMLKIKDIEKKYFLDSVYCELTYPEPIGVDNLISIDLIEDKSLLKKEKRSGYEVNCIDVKYAGENKTNNLIVVFDKNNLSKIITVWPGKYAPDFPREIKNPNDPKEKEIHEACKFFWENHVFITE